MIKQFLLLFTAMLVQAGLYAQVDSVHSVGDTTAVINKDLNVYTITAYEQESRIVETPAGVGVLDPKRLGQYNNTSILPAVNTVPGVRMEERSPGSYRFSIRGSSVASPFGVRNVKVYYNGIPYTEAGGNTYLNQLGFYNFQSVTIIKGPGSSLYGAGTGGVILINSMEEPWQPGVSLDYTGGSYGLSSAAIGVRLGDSALHNSIKYQHLQADGYRQQSKTRKDVLSWDTELKTKRGTTLAAHFLYGDLYYQTPGALTLAEYNADPQQARPATAAAPGAISSNAAIYQKTILAGFSATQPLGLKWDNSTTVFADYATQLNPNIRNYSRTAEPNFGGRSVFRYKGALRSVKLQWVTGAEYVQGFANNKVYKNVNGQPQYLQTDQEINNTQLSGFTQFAVSAGRWQLTGGASLNKLQTKLATPGAQVYDEQTRIFTNQLAPRLALLYKAADDVGIFATVAKGFSPPTTDELAPTGGQVNLGLNPEQGWNYEAGMHAYSRDHRLYADVSLFYFGLQDAIVLRKDAAGGDQYVNAGSTKQMGLEAYSSYGLVQQGAGFVQECTVYASYTAHDFHYDKFVQASGDFSGRQLPGTALNTIAAGLYIGVKHGFYANVTSFYSDRTALNDANTAYANAYNNLGAKLGYRLGLRKYTMNLYAGADNMLNQVYSLGNDINTAGGRYYNAAAPRNYYVGVSLGWAKAGY